MFTRLHLSPPQQRLSVSSPMSLETDVAIHQQRLEYGSLVTLNSPAEPTLGDKLTKRGRECRSVVGLGLGLS